MFCPLDITTYTTCLFVNHYTSCGVYLPFHLQLAHSSKEIWVLQVAKSDSANRDPLVDLFGYVEDVLKRLKINPEVTVIPGVTQILVKIMAELVFVFAIATNDVKDGPLSESVFISKSLSNVALRELCKNTTGGDRRREDPMQVRSAHSGGGSEDSRAYS